MIKQFNDPNRFLSNFWICNVKYAGETYPSLEHAYQAAKTKDKKARKQIQKCITPGGAKRLGRAVVMRPNWEKINIKVMRKLLYRKFKYPKLRKRLLATGDLKLQEGNYWNDRFWGVCLKTGKGKNWLGKLLMKVRKSLQKEKS